MSNSIHRIEQEHLKVFNIINPLLDFFSNFLFLCTGILGGLTPHASLFTPFCVYPSRQRYDRRALPYHKTDQPEPANCLAQPLSVIDVIDMVSSQQLDALATDLTAKILLRFAGFLMQYDLVFRSAVFLAMIDANTI